MSDEQNKKRCGAKTKNDGTCRNSPIVGGNGRCYMHNGNAAKGVDHYNYKHGNRSKYRSLPKAVLESFEHHRDNPDALSQRDEIAAHNVLAEDAFQRWANGEPMPDYAKLLTTWNKFDNAGKAKNYTKVNELLPEIGKLITQGATAQGHMEHYMKVAEKQRRVIESERKRAVEQSEMVKTAVVAVAIERMARLTIEAVMGHIEDQQLQRLIIGEVQRGYLTIIPNQ